MDKGIRPFARTKFAELNEQRRRSLLTNTQFRKNVMCSLMEEFGCTLASAATHYNEAFKFLKELNAELVSGLGRPEDKKGGRKKKVVVAPALQDVPAVQFIDQQFTEGAQALAEYVEPVQTVFNVCKKSDGSVVAEGLSFEAAQELVNKAAAAKKAKLYWV